MSIAREMEKASNIGEQMTAGLERSLKAKYRYTNTQFKGMFANLYAEYGEEGKLTYAEMQKYNRIQMIEKQVSNTINDLYLEEKKLMNSRFKDIYESGYYRTAFALEKDLQAKLSYQLLDTNKIRRAIQNPISGLTLNQTMLKNKVQIKGRINQEIVQGLVRGEGYGKMSKRISEAVGFDANKAIRVAQTESHRIHNQAALDSVDHANDLGVNTVKRWVSTLDGDTRSAHRSLDGQKADNKGNFHSNLGGMGPAPGSMANAADDINCRCTFYVDIEGVSQDFRRIRGEGVVPYTNYDDWADAKGFQ